MDTFPVEDLRRIECNPGDVFVLHSNTSPTLEHVEAIQAAWSLMMPDHKLLIIVAGELSVIPGEFLDAVKG